MDRPPFIRRWSEIEGEDDAHHPGDSELVSIGAPLGRMLVLTRLGIHHERLPPGRRTSYPHAESAEEEFVFVLEGEPGGWIDGHLHRLRPGDAVAIPAGTGIAHTVINDTDREARLLVVGEATNPENRIYYPLREASTAGLPDHWAEHPGRPLGPHDGRPRRRGGKAG